MSNFEHTTVQRIRNIANIAFMGTGSKRASFIAYYLWYAILSSVFFSIYVYCNATSAIGTQTHHLYFPLELKIPFVPGFIFIYLSIYVLFLMPPLYMEPKTYRMLGIQNIVATVIAAIIFLLYPTTLGFNRIKPEELQYAMIYSSLFSLDQPYNMMPSLHVAYSSTVVFAIIDIVESIAMKWMYLGWLGLICLSTLLVHQHHLVDVIAGILLAWMIRSICSRIPSYS